MVDLQRTRIENVSDLDQLVCEGIKNITPYIAGKPLEELEREYGITGAVKLASNENPLGPSPKAIEALLNHLHSIHRYPDANSYKLKQMLAEKFDVPPDAILPANGSNEIIELVLKTFLRPGGEVIVPEPSFSLYTKFTQALDGVPIKAPLKEFSVDLEAMKEKIGPRTRIVIINNPNNPTGTIVRKTAFEQFIRSIPENIVIIVDEAYGEFVTDPDFPQGHHYLTDKPWVITMKTFSKAYGLAGLRIGYGIAAPEIMHYLNRVRQPFNVNLLAQVAACAALTDHDHVIKTLRTVNDGLHYFYQNLKQRNIEFIPTQANYLMIRVGKNSDTVYEALLKEGVIVRSLTSFGFHDYIRVSVGTPSENQRFIASLDKVLHHCS
ncbi:MAG: histidinol-phosphate transaminase [Deltaproteobacteria bacterium]|nr:histidinol-phosphate transaminase [Deltaproteobacteria bacterium]